MRVEGAAHTRQSFLAWLINPHLRQTSDSSTLESVLHTTRRLSHIFQETDVFHTVEAKIERSRDAMAEDGDVDIVFKTREKGRYFLKTATEMGNAEGNAVSIVLCNFNYILLLSERHRTRTKCIRRCGNPRSQFVPRYKDTSGIPSLLLAPSVLQPQHNWHFIYLWPKPR